MKLKELFRTSWVKKNGKDVPEKKNNSPEAEKDKSAKTDTPEISKSQQSPDKGESQPRQPQAHVRASGKQEAPDTTATLEPLAYADPQDWLGSNRDPDVMLSVPNLGIDHIGLNVKNVRAHVDLHAKVLDLVELHVGADVSIEEVDLQINNVRVQAMLKVKLEKVREIVGDVVGLLDNHPEILSNLTGGLGRGLEGALSRKPGEADQLSEEEKTALRKMLQEADKDQQNTNIESSSDGNSNSDGNEDQADKK